MPLTDFEQTKTTLLVEQEIDSEQYTPLSIKYGEISMFYGTFLKHYAPANISTYTRISLDFRIGIVPYYDPTWEFQGLKGKHKYKICHI